MTDCGNLNVHAPHTWAIEANPGEDGPDYFQCRGRPRRRYFDHDTGCVLDMGHHPTPCLTGPPITPPTRSWSGSTPEAKESTMTRMAACRDIDPARLLAMLPGAELPPVYPGSIAGACQTCDVPVWVGPRIQQAIAVLGDVEVLCFPCAVQADPTGLVNLGNPYKPR